MNGAPLSGHGRKREVLAGERTGAEPHHARGRVDDHHPARPVQLTHFGSQLPDPHHVEDDVQQTAVQPGCAQQRPPAAVLEHRLRAGRAENKQTLERWRQNPEQAAAHGNAAPGERDDVHDRAQPGDEGDEAEIMSEASERRREAEQRRVPAAAVIALLVLDADQVSARHADDGAGRLPPEHDLEA